MKKCLGMFFGGLLLSTVASASSIILSCTGFSSPNGQGSFSAQAIVCPQFVPPGSEGLYDVIVYATDSFNQGAPFSAGFNNSFQFFYNPLNPQLGIASYTDTVTGSGAPPSDESGATFFQLGNEIFTGLGAWDGAGTVSIGSVTGSTLAGGLQQPIGGSGGGQISFNVFVQYDYGTVPEPVTMVLVGGGLLGVGLLASKRRKKA